MKKVLFIVISFFIFILSGCGNPPQPYSQKIKTNYTNVSSREKQRLLNNIIDYYIPQNSSFYTKNDGCIYFNDAWYHFQYINKFKNCFIIKGNKIVREDESKCSDNYGRKFTNFCDYIGGRSDEYSKFIDKIQKTLYSHYINQLKSYSIFKQACIKYDKQRNKKLKQIKVSIIDNTGLLPQNIIKNIHTEIYAPSVNYLKTYLNLLTLKNKKIKFPVCVQIKNDGFHYIIDGRYEIYFKGDNICKPYTKFPIDYKIFIKSVYFNFIPNKFIVKNKDLTIVINNITNKLTVYNHSNQFIEINSIVLYYGNIVSSKIFQFDQNAMHLKLRIPPESYVSKYINFPEARQIFVKLTNKDQIHKYGISLSYKKIDENILKTLFKVKKFSVKDFKVK